MKKKRVLSGIQPSGKLHLGNLIGAVENWVRLQEKYECYFFIADLHALTSGYADTKEFRNNLHDVTVNLLSSGLDPEKAVIFRQSDLPEHSELHLLFSMITPISWLERVPTYKDKINELKDRDLYTYGFLGYPVLQAADILIYKADLVPVGRDQLPHLELTREIARRFNHFYGPVFPEPKEDLTEVPVLPGLDGRKMSKTYGNTIDLCDSAETVDKKVGQMVTDPARVKKDDPGHPDVCPVYAYHKIFNKDRVSQVARDCSGAKIGCVQCKKELAKVLNDYLVPIRKRRKEFIDKPGHIQKILEDGAERAKKIARPTLAQAKKAMGITY